MCLFCYSFLFCWVGLGWVGLVVSELSCSSVVVNHQSSVISRQSSVVSRQSSIIIHHVRFVLCVIVPCTSSVKSVIAINYGHSSIVIHSSSASSDQPAVISHLPAVISQQSSAISHQSSVICHLPAVISQQSSVISHLSSASSHQPAAISHQSSVISHQPSAISHQSSVISHLPSASSHLPSVISQQSSVISHQSSHFSRRDRVQCSGELTDGRSEVVRSLQRQLMPPVHPLDAHLRRSETPQHGLDVAPFVLREGRG